MPSPATDEIEVTLFGPALGESVLLHVGGGAWVIVDSCLSSGPDAEPLPVSYLREIGVDPAHQVQLVVVTHWHDDHIGGMASLVQTCRRAKLAFSQAFTSHDFIAGVHVVEPSSMIARSGVREFWEIWKHCEAESRPPRHASADQLLWSRAEDPSARVVALSPSDADVRRGMEQLRGFVVNELGSPLEYVPALSPNEASVAVWVTVGSEHVLLGADLECPADRQRGWLAVLHDVDECRGKRATVFKVAHHGSSDAYESRVWRDMLISDAIALVSPFQKGSAKLPSQDQMSVLCGESPNVYLTSGASPTLEVSDAVRQTLAETTESVEPVTITAGHVRLRKRIGTADSWSVELFGPAMPVCDPDAT